MKKPGIVMVLVFLGGIRLFALQESWVSYGFGFGNYLDRTAEEGAYTGMPGFMFGAYRFGERRNVGWFSQWGILFPTISPERWDTGYGFDFIAGPGFRAHLGDTVNLHFGVGIDWLFEGSGYTEEATDYSRWRSSVGIGGDMGIKVDLTDNVYIDLGVTGSYFFLGWESRQKSVKIDEQTTTRTKLSGGRIADFLAFGVKPYLCIGFNSYVGKTALGKPPKT